MKERKGSRILLAFFSAFFLFHFKIHLQIQVFSTIMSMNGPSVCLQFPLLIAGNYRINILNRLLKYKTHSLTCKLNPCVPYHPMCTYTCKKQNKKQKKKHLQSCGNISEQKFPLLLFTYLYLLIVRYLFKLLISHRHSCYFIKFSLLSPVGSLLLFHVGS